jgi:hypothetical protein
MNRLGYSEITIESILKEMGQNILFVEVGVLKATTLVHIADKCPNVSSIVGIDSYQPYVDSLEFDCRYSVNASLAAMNRHIAQKKISRSSRPEIIDLLLLDCIAAAKLFDDKSVDCIFLDAYMSEEDVCKHTKTWLPKVKNGGVLLGHDVHTTAVKNGLSKLGIKFNELDHNIWIHTT